MNLRTSWTLIGLLAVSVVAISGCSKTPPLPSSLSSPDGMVTLHLDGVELPEGVNAEDIRVVALTNGDEGLQASHAYDLLPDGTTFSTPIPVTLTFPRDEQGIVPFLMHSTANSTEVIQDVEITEDLDANTITFETTLSHFSKIRTTNHGFKVTSVGGGEYAVGGSTPFKLTVTPTSSDVGIWNSEKKRYYGADIKRDAPYNVESIKFFMDKLASSPLSPASGSIPGKAAIPGDQGTTFYTSFFCEKAGKATVRTSVKLSYTIDYYPDRGYANVTPTKKESAGATSYNLINTYTCSDDLMVRVVPYLFICPNGGPSRSGSYLTDATTGEPITNAAGEKLDSITGKPIPPCPKVN